MASTLPNGFVTIAEAYKDRDRSHNIIGICTDSLEPTQTRGTDATCKFKLWDPSCVDVDGLGSEGLVVRFFKPMQKLPRIQAVGDIVVLRNIPTSEYRGLYIALANFKADATWNVFSGTTLAQSCDPAFSDVTELGLDAESSRTDRSQGQPLTAPVLEYAKSIILAKDPFAGHVSVNEKPVLPAIVIHANTCSGMTRNTKFRLFQDLKHPNEHDGLQFVDFIGEIRRIFSGSNPVEIQVTDYTDNHHIYNHTRESAEGDQYGYIKPREPWLGPWGQKTLLINVWDDLGIRVLKLAEERKLKIGSIVRVNNVLVQTGRDSGKLRGQLRGDKAQSGSGIILLDSQNSSNIPEVNEFLKRRDEYWQIEGPDLAVTGRGPNNKRSHSEVQGNGTAQEKPSKSARRREKKKDVKAQKVQKEQARADQLAAKAESERQNPNVRTEKCEVELSTIADILDHAKLPQTTTNAGNNMTLNSANRRYKSRVQVVDFFPDSLHGFACPYRIVTENENTGRQEIGDMVEIDVARQNPDKVKWLWQFFLVVKDPETVLIKQTPLMLLQIEGAGAEQLLNMDACDLQHQSNDLAKLKEKLFLLWGDLEEKRQEYNNKTGLQLSEEGVKVSSRPFECLIQESGVQPLSEDGKVQKDKWERVFSIFGTTV